MQAAGGAAEGYVGGAGRWRCCTGIVVWISRSACARVEPVVSTGVLEKSLEIHTTIPAQQRQRPFTFLVADGKWLGKRKRSGAMECESRKVTTVVGNRDGNERDCLV